MTNFEKLAKTSHTSCASSPNYIPTGTPRSALKIFGMETVTSGGCHVCLSVDFMRVSAFLVIAENFWMLCVCFTTRKCCCLFQDKAP